MPASVCPQCAASVRVRSQVGVNVLDYLAEQTGLIHHAFHRPPHTDPTAHTV